MSKKTLIIGASEKPNRYSYMAMELLQAFKHEVVAIGAKAGVAAGISYDRELTQFEDIDTVSLYINSKIQEGYIDYLLELKPKRIIFNPGTENRGMYKTFNDAGIETTEACTLVLLRTGQY